METLILIGRILFGGYFLYSGIGHFKNVKHLSAYAKSKGIPPSASDFLVMFTGLMLIIGGVGVIFFIYIQVAVILLLLFMIPTTFIMHNFWKKGLSHEQKASDHISFFKNLALIGALLMMISQ